jgi:hypothetical protein
MAKNTPAAPVARTATFTLEKATKNTLKFVEDTVEGQAPIIGQLYVQKHAVPSTCTKVTVSVTAEPAAE